MKYKPVKYSLLVFAIFLAVSCTKKEDAMINQTFALPMGAKELFLEIPDINTATSTPGTYGTYFFNGRPYKANELFFISEIISDFYIDSPDKLKRITKIDLKIKTENAYPTVPYFQIYLRNEANLIIDSVFTQGPQVLEPGKTDQINDISEAFILVVSPDPSFEDTRLEHLKAAKTLLYKAYIKTKKEDNSTAYFSIDNKLNLNLALRLYLEYSSNEL